MCAGALSGADGALRCAAGHSHDVARHGHVTLVAGGRRLPEGDDAAMVAAREAVLAAGHLAPVTDALRDAVAVVPGDGPVVLDVGAGTGHHLAAVLDALPGARGVAVDVSRVALRRAVRVHDRIAAVVADVWAGLPLRDATADVVLDVFSPRNPAELARVMAPGGLLLVVTPGQEHLRELAEIHGVRVDPRKDERVRDQLVPLFGEPQVRRIEWTLRLTRAEASDLVRMGPAARHLTPEAEERLATLAEPVPVTAVVDLHAFRR